MYNSQNLPLSKKKIVKKTFPTIFPTFILFSFLEVIIILFVKALGPDVKNIALSNFAAYFPILLPLLWFVISMGTVVYQYLYYKLYYYNFEEKNAEISKGVVARSTGIVRYNRIQNLYVDQDLMDRFLGLYDVHYETAGETSSFYSHVDGLNKENSDKLIDFLKYRIGNPAVESERDGYSEILENPTNTQHVDNMISFSRDNIQLSKKYLITSAVFNAEIMVLVGLISSRFIITATQEVTSFNWLWILIAFPPIFLLTMIYSWLWLKFFSFEFGDRSVHIQKGVISRNTQYIYYNRIQNINIDQSFLNRLLGICYLNVETAGESTATFQIPGLHVEDAKTLQNFLMEKSQRSHTNSL